MPILKLRGRGNAPSTAKKSCDVRQDALAQIGDGRFGPQSGVERHAKGEAPAPVQHAAGPALQSDKNVMYVLHDALLVHRVPVAATVFLLHHSERQQVGG